MTPRFLIIQIIGVTLFIAAWWRGMPQLLWANDPTYLTGVIAGLGVFGLVLAAFGRWAAADFISYELPVLGILGTFIGLQMAVDASAGDFAAMRAALGTAFGTTIAGILGAAWLRLSRQLS